MTVKQVIGLLAAVLIGAAPLSAQTEVTVSTPEALRTALTEITSGSVIALAPGDYGALTVRGINVSGPPAIIRSADPENPARLTGLGVSISENLIFDDLFFDYVFEAGDDGWYRPFLIVDSRNIAIRRSRFEGDNAYGVDGVPDGFGTGYGLSVRDSDTILIEDNEVSGFERGMYFAQLNNVVVRGNDVHSMRMDGMNFAEVHNVLIEANHIHDFRRAVDWIDHADMIQFWSANTAAPSTNVVIRNNLLNSGDGWYTQSIFMRNEMVDMGQAGDEMFYRNILIEENVIINAHLHGITVGETDGLLIRNNTIVRNAASEGPQDNPPVWIPRILIAEPARNVQITHNITSTISGYTDQPNWRIADNVLVQDASRLQPGFYGQFFDIRSTVDPTDIGAFAYLPGGPLDGAGIGASWLDTPTPRIPN